MAKHVYHKVLLLVLTTSLPSHAAEGGIYLGQTRVIFSATDKAQTLTVANSGERNYLIQALTLETPDSTAAAPFIITPPLFTLQGNQRQLLRILPLNAALPADRESLFYLSLSAIPAQREPVSAQDRLSIGLRFVVKLFYRPATLLTPASTTPCQLVFRTTAQGLQISNPTAYFQTLGKLTINGQPVALEQQPAMVPPLDSITLAMHPSVKKITWRVITDYGGLSHTCQQDGPRIMENAS